MDPKSPIGGNTADISASQPQKRRQNIRYLTVLYSMAEVHSCKNRIGQAAVIINSILSLPDKTSSVNYTLNESPPMTTHRDSVETKLACLFRAGAASRSSVGTPGNQGKILLL